MPKWVCANCRETVKGDIYAHWRAYHAPPVYVPVPWPIVVEGKRI